MTICNRSISCEYAGIWLVEIDPDAGATGWRTHGQSWMKLDQYNAPFIEAATQLATIYRGRSA